MDLRNKKIAVVGVGGVGGYLAGVLAKAYPDQVTMAARGARLEAIKKDGLKVHSDLSGEFCIQPAHVVTADQLEEQDYIFLCVKNYSLEEACAQIAHAVGEHTVVIPVMNGIDTAQRVREQLGKGIVADAVIYIVAFTNECYEVIHQGYFARLRIGIQHADEQERQALAEVSELLTGAGVEHLVAEDIELEVWRKYILNCAYNVATAAYDNAIGQLREDSLKSQEFLDLVSEAYEVAKAKGVAVLPEHKKEFFDRFRMYRKDATSSLQRDLAAGRPAEIDTFSGYLVREAKRLGVAVPVSEKMYGLLQERAARSE